MPSGMDDEWAERAPVLVTRYKSTVAVEDTPMWFRSVAVVVVVVVACHTAGAGAVTRRNSLHIPMGVAPLVGLMLQWAADTAEVEEAAGMQGEAADTEEEAVDMQEEEAADIQGEVVDTDMQEVAGNNLEKEESVAYNQKAA